MLQRLFHGFDPQQISEYASGSKSFQLRVSLMFFNPRYDTYCKIWVKGNKIVVILKHRSNYQYITTQVIDGNGHYLIIFRPFKVEDFIEAAGVTGIVEKIEIFTTQLKALDNKSIIVPNSKLTGDNIINYTTKEIRRVDLIVGVSYEDGIDKVKAAINDVLSSEEMVLKYPAPTVAVFEMADSSVNFVVRPWTKTENYWDTYFSVTENIKKEFDSRDITIPFPQRDVHLYDQEIRPN